VTELVSVLTVQDLSIFAVSRIVAGKYNFNPTPPFTPGFEVAGEIASLGEGDTKWRVGQRVVAMPGYGGYAQYVIAKQSALVEIAGNVDYITAAAFPVAYTTSHLALKVKARLQPGETLLVHGASGGVGLTAVELGAAMGATVIATASSVAKLEVAKSKGAKHLILSSEPGVDKKVRRVSCSATSNSCNFDVFALSICPLFVTRRALWGAEFGHDLLCSQQACCI